MRSPQLRLLSSLLGLLFVVGCDDAGGGGVGATGHFYGPVGSQLRLSIGSDVVTASIVTPKPAVYGSASFQFAQGLSAGVSYSVVANAAPANQSCQVYMGQTGAAPIADGALRAGCEWTFDLVSRSTDDSVATGADYSNHPAMSGDGRYVAFTSSKPGLAGNTTNALHVFWRDRLTGRTLLLSKSADGKEGDARSDQPAISADGLTVAFRSDSTNLVTGDANKVGDVFIGKIDPSSGSTTLVRASIGPSGEEANASSETPTLSGDGRVLAFATNATNVAAGSNDSTLNHKIVRRDLAAGTSEIVSLRPNGEAASGHNPKLSEDGNRVAYYSYSDLRGDLSPSLWDMFVYESSTHANWPVTLTQSGGTRSQGPESVSGIRVPAISGDGKWVAYTTASPNVASGFDNKKVHVYVVEVDACKASGCNVKPVDMTPDGAQSDDDSSSTAVLSGDGRWVAFTSAAPSLGGKKGVTNVFLHDRDANATARLTDIQSTYSANEYLSISRSGAYIAFGCESELDPRFPDTSGYGGLYALFTGHGPAFAWPTGPLSP